MPVGIILLALPLTEIALFVLVGQQIGVLGVIGLVLLAGLAGLTLIRHGGTTTLRHLQQAIGTGEDPLNPVAHGALRIVAGLLLILPGFLSDAAAIILLIPAARRGLLARLAPRLARRRHPAATVIDGEWSVAEPPREDGPDRLGR